MKRLMPTRFLKPLYSFAIGSIFVLAILFGFGSASFVLAELGGWGAFDIRLGQLEFFEYEILDNGGWAVVYGSGVFYLAILAGLLNALRPLLSVRQDMATLHRD